MFAKSVVFDIADSRTTGVVGLRQVDFYSLGTKLTITSSNCTGYATTTQGGNPAVNTFDTTLSLTGDSGYGWYTSSAGTNQRLIVVFDALQEFDAIIVNNYHHNGGYTTRGVKNVKIYFSVDEVTDTTYNATISNSVLIYDGQFNEHVSSDTADPEELTLINEKNIVFDFPMIGFDGLGWSGNSLIWPSIPIISPAIEATFHTPGLITTFPSLNITVEGSFTPNIVEIDTEFPALSFVGHLTSNKINLITTLPNIACQILSGAQIIEEFPSLTFSGELESIKSGNIATTFPSLSALFQTGEQVKVSFPGLEIVLQGNSVDVESVVTASVATFLPSLGCLIFGDSSIGAEVVVTLPILTCEIISQNRQDQILRHIRGAVR